MKLLLQYLKLNLLLVLVFCSAYSFSQVTFIIQQTNPYNFSTKDVWNLSIINPFPSDIDARLTGIIYDAGQQKIAQLTSSVIKINDYPLTYFFLPYHVSSNEILINLSNKS